MSEKQGLNLFSSPLFVSPKFDDVKLIQVMGRVVRKMPEQKLEKIPTFDTCKIVNMFAIWEHLIPFLELESTKKLLKVIFEATFRDASRGEDEKDWPSYESVKGHFCGTKAEYQDIITHPEPWTKYPWITFSTCEEPNDDPELIEAYNNYKMVKEEALKSGPTSIWW